MPAFLADSSCMVAALCGWHIHHARSRKEIEARLANDETLISAGHALIETYSVLTRLPPPHRISPADSRTLIRAAFMDGVTLVGADQRFYRTLLDEAPEAGIAGGRVYDALIVALARKGGASVLLTFNPKHFEGLDGDGLSIVVPAAG